MNRYEPRRHQSINGVFAIVMDSDDNGTYITYESHRHEIECLQARLKALESNQKDSISISAIIAEHVEDALRKSIGETVHHVVGDMLKAGLNKYNGDPCHNTVDSILGELPVGPGKTVKADFTVADELTKNSKFTFGYGNRHDWSVGECESARDRKVAVCFYVGGNGFIKGGEYEYEVDECETGPKPSVIHITQDAFLSGLKGDYRWRALKVGNVINANGELVDAYAALNIYDGVVAQFYIK